MNTLALLDVADPAKNGGALFLWLAIGGLLFGIIGAIIGTSAGKGSIGFLCGTFLGPLGLILIAILCVGQRRAGDSTHSAGCLADLSRPLPTARSPLQDAPDMLTIRRDGVIIGTWPLADALEYLALGNLLPGDHYLQNPATNSWRLLSNLA